MRHPGIFSHPCTGYDIVDNQVVLKPTAAERGGVQPVVKLLAEGSERAHVKAGQTVSFQAQIDIPPAAGELERVEWSFEGEQDYPHAGTIRRQWAEGGCRCASAEAQHVFTKPGTYFCVARVTSNRNRGDGYTRLHNLCRVRVIVG